MHTLRSRAPVGRALVLAAAGLAACGGGDAAPAQTLPVPESPLAPRLTFVAENIAFTRAEVGVAANTAFTIVLENRDGVPHNVAIAREGAGSLPRPFVGAVFTGPGTRWYAVGGLVSGAYVFVCDVHPNMTGRLVAS